MINFLIERGWFLKVSPGTKFATLGGCIASDVHGKEHHKEGCFSESVLKIKMLINKNQIIEFTKDSHPDLFKATCGGMGLTGFIIEAEIKCKKVLSSEIKYKKVLTNNLDNLFEKFEKFEEYNYSVAWLDTKKEIEIIDQFLLVENLAPSKSSKFQIKNITIPFKFNFINNFTINIFNLLYFYFCKISKKNGYLNYNKFFYPLDGLNNWYKLYGKNGFLQYQFIIPKKRKVKLQ